MSYGYIVVLNFHCFGMDTVHTVVGSNVSEDEKTARKFAEYLVSANSGKSIKWDTFEDIDGSMFVDSEGYAETDDGFVNVSLKRVRIP